MIEITEFVTESELRVLLVCLIASASGLMSAFHASPHRCSRFRFLFSASLAFEFALSDAFFSLCNSFCHSSAISCYYFLFVLFLCLSFILFILVHLPIPRICWTLHFLFFLDFLSHGTAQASLQLKAKKRFLCAAAICFVMFQWITFLLSYVVVVFVALRCIWFVFHAICFHVLLNLHASLPSSQNNVYVTKCWQGESFTQFSFLRQTCFATKNFRDTTWMYVFQGNQTFTKLVSTQQVFTAKVYMPHNGRFRMKICYMVFFQ